MKKLILLVGPPRAGTRLVSWAISRLKDVEGMNAYKEPLGCQDLDDLWDISTADAVKKINELVPADKHALIRRCQPHAGRWYSFDTIKEIADAAGRELVLAVLTRDRTIIYQSHYRTFNDSQRWQERKLLANKWLDQAYDAVFDAIDKYNLKYFIINYETLMWLKDRYILMLADALEISQELVESVATRLDDGNKKYIETDEKGCNEPTEFSRPDLHPKYITDENTD